MNQPPSESPTSGASSAATMLSSARRSHACSDMDLATANAIYAGMSPIPVAYFTDKLDLKVFYKLISTGEIKTS